MRSERLLEQAISNKKMHIMIYHNEILHILLHSMHTTAKRRGPNP